MTRKRRYVRAALLGAVLLLSLSSCVKLDMDMTVRADNTVDGTLVMAVDKSVLNAMGVSESDIARQFDAQGPFTGANRPKHGSISQRRYDEGGKVGQLYTFTNVPLSEFGGANGLSITRKQDRFYVVGIVDMTTGERTDPREKAIAEKFTKSAETRIRLTFPGEVIKSNGKIDGRSVTWHPKIGQRTKLTAEARTSAIIPVLVAGGGAVAALLLIAALVTFLLLRRRRRNNAYAYGSYPGDGTGPSGYAPDSDPTAYPRPPGYREQPPLPVHPSQGARPDAAGPPPMTPRPPDATQPLPRFDPSSSPPGRPYSG
ncbi:MAG: hypothetical protein WCB04_04175 [Mycobacteriales bacterium]